MNGKIISREPDVSTFKFGQGAAAHYITINDEADIPADNIIRQEAQRLKAVILNQFIFADGSKYAASFKKQSRPAPESAQAIHTAPH